MELLFHALLLKDCATRPAAYYPLLIALFTVFELRISSAYTSKWRTQRART